MSGSLLKFWVKVIEELAEWIDHAFERYRQKTNPVVQTLVAPKLEQQRSSPLTSETETDDTGITFIPRRAMVVPCVGSCDSSSDTTLVSDARMVVRTQTPEKGSTATISESELMRRRRLISL